MQKLGALKDALDGQHSAVLRTVFSYLFPFGPAWNSILGTFYISSCVAPTYLSCRRVLTGRDGVAFPT